MEILHLLIFFIWMFILIGSSFLIDNILARIASPTAHRIFVGIGVIVHEYSHALACVLTRTKIHSIKLFESTGGHVTHQKRNSVVMAIIAIAPLFGGVIVIILLAMLFGYIGVVFHGAFIALHGAGFMPAFLQILYAALLTIYDNIALLNPISIFFIVFLYFTGSVTAVLAPSAKDLKNGAIGLVLLFILGSIVIYLKPFSYIPGMTDRFGTTTPVLDFIISWISKGIAIGMVAVIIFLVPLLLILVFKHR